MKNFNPMLFLVCALVVFCSSLQTVGAHEYVITEDRPTYGYDDVFSQTYPKEHDMVFSIQEQLDENQQDLVKHIYCPGWTYQTDTYRIEIVEMLADNYQAFANVKFSSISADAIVRPFLCAEDGKYYISPAECKGEVFFFEYVFYPTNRPPQVSNSSIGLSLSGTEMNDVNTWSYSGTANRFRYNNSEMTFVFDMKIGRYDNHELVIERVTCEVICPVLPTVDICYFEATKCIEPEFHRTNTHDPEFVIVLTPLDMYCKQYPASAIIPEEECGYWVVKIDDVEMNRLSSSTRYTEIPKDISLILYTNDQLRSVAGQWQLKRVGNCFLPVYN